jgi:hypothetical protein
LSFHQLPITVQSGGGGGWTLVVGVWLDMLCEMLVCLVLSCCSVCFLWDTNPVWDQCLTSPADTIYYGPTSYAIFFMDVFWSVCALAAYMLFFGLPLIQTCCCNSLTGITTNCHRPLSILSRSVFRTSTSLVRAGVGRHSAFSLCNANLNVGD